jgi:hypothetical protein
MSMIWFLVACVTSADGDITCPAPMQFEVQSDCHAVGYGYSYTARRLGGKAEYICRGIKVPEPQPFPLFIPPVSSEDVSEEAVGSDEPSE